MPSPWLLAGYALVLLLLVPVLLLLHRWGHLVFYLLEYLHIKLLAWWFVRQRRTVVDMFKSRVSRSPSSVFLVFEGSSYTYAAVDSLSDGVAYWALQQGFQCNDVVALMMDNRPEFIICWLGLAKVGVTTALINTNMKGQPLLHSLDVCSCQALIVDTAHLPQVEDVRYALPRSLRLYSHGAGGGAAGYADMTAALNALPSPPPSASFASHRTSLSSSSLLFYIFTSGTTGMPKAARIRHSRFYLGAVSFSVFFHLTAADRLYSPLPLYHSVGGILAVGMSWHCGCSLVLRRRFSASQFFRECSEQEVTVMLYIGQLCRYLLQSPRSLHDRSHRIRLAIGNGLPAAIWPDFQRRFGIPRIGEFYASTEGNANLVNNRNRVGAIGYIPWLARLVYPVRIVAFDYSTERPLRDARTGFCIEAKEGELIGRMSSDPLRSFDGYSSREATSEKVLTSVFRQRDQWFRTGDLVRMDSDGFVFFVDRIGDTFRWKGENCATTEVERTVAGWPEVKEVNVYGVRVDGNDGKAGMAAIVLSDDRDAAAVRTDAFDFKAFYESGNDAGRAAQALLPPAVLTLLLLCCLLCSQLSAAASRLVPAASVPADPEGDGQTAATAASQPEAARHRPHLSCSRPLVLPQAVTSTFKLRKVDMVADGFDPSRTSDPLFFRSDAQRTYIALDDELYQRIMQGQVRL